MKKTILLAIATLFATVSYAQQQLATLNHNDSITVFYGASALSQAHAAAVNGDIITLSPGKFNSMTIQKAITIRGAGMLSDSLGNLPTEIYGTTEINIPEDTLHNLVIEGIFFNYYSGNYYNNLEWISVYRPVFIKCKFTSNLSYSNFSYNNATMVDARFINCIILGQFGNYRQTNTLFVNSYLENMNLYSGDNYGHISIINSIAKIDINTDNVLKVFSMNSILIRTNSTSYFSHNNNATTSYYSIGLYNSSYSYYFDTAATPDHFLYNMNSYSSVFKYYNGTYSDGVSFELQDSIANTILGDDGNQVGIFGGPYPFNPNVRNPRIKRCSVAQRATADNKLAVDIEVVSE